jgi:hypothetical protein
MPKPPQGAFLSSPRVTAFEVILEEATRATSETAARFVEPAPGTLSRATSNRHHLLFGRRGSGKTSLLLKAQTDLIIGRRPNAFIDMEKFKSHSYPDVLISVLIETMENLQGWLKGGAIAPASKTSFWRKLIRSPARKPLNKSTATELALNLETAVKELQQLLYAQDGASLETLEKSLAQSGESTEAGVGVGKGPLSAQFRTGSQRTTEEGIETREHLRRSKVDFLKRRVMDYQKLFREIVGLAGGDGFLLLDDFYQIPRDSQAEVLDYFHSLIKNTGLWLKVGTIRHRSRWYKHGDPPVGMKLGDDVDEIDLDVTLEKYQTAKRFLLEILQQLASENQIKLAELLTDGARDRLVLASGGVARDFLSILRKSIVIAREGGEGRVGAEAVNQAAGEHESTKRDEFRRDALDGEDELNVEFESVKRFCLVTRKVNCILVEKDLQTATYENIKELVDLRLLHAIAGRVTVRDRPGRIFEGYMVDVSQYTGERKQRGLQMLEFWDNQGREELRRSSLIYAESPSA